MRRRSSAARQGADGGRSGGFVTRDADATSRGTVPNRTVQYRTVPYHTVSYAAGRTHDSEDLTLSLSKKAKGKESHCGKPAKMWKTLWKVCGKPAAAGNGAGAGQAGRGVTWCRSTGRGAAWCGTAGWGAAWCGTVSRGVAWCGTVGRGAVWCGLAAGCAVAIVRSRTRELRRAHWLAFFPREKMLDKLCKSILDWKQEIKQEAARDRRRRRGRDASTASGEQSSPPSPRGEGLWRGTGTRRDTGTAGGSRDLFTSSGEQSSPPSPRGEGLGCGTGRAAQERNCHSA